MNLSPSAIAVVSFAILSTACSISSSDDDTSFGADAIVLDVRCAADTDCPSGYECEDETEHGVDQSFCVLHDADQTGQCPAGYELEEEHGGTFCKPHGGGNDDSGNGNEGASCSTDADCEGGLECEVETEHGETTSVCKAHGGD